MNLNDLFSCGQPGLATSGRILGEHPSHAPGISFPVADTALAGARLSAWDNLAATEHLNSKHVLRSRLSRALLIISDLIVIWGALALAGLVTALAGNETWSSRLGYSLADEGVLRLSGFLVVSSTLVMWFWAGLHHYTNMRPFWDEIKEILLGVALALVADAAFSYLLKNQLSRVWLVSVWLCIAALLPLNRWWVKGILRRSGWLDQPYVIVGGEDELQATLAALQDEPLMAFRPLAFVTLDTTEDGTRTVSFEVKPGGRTQPQAVPVFQLDETIERFLCQASGVKIVFLPGDRESAALQALRQRISLVRDDIYMVPSLSGLPVYGVKMYHFFSHEVVLLRAKNNLNQRSARWVKRLFDVLASAMLLAVLSPLLCYVALRIKRESPGPVVFTQQRVGLNGRHFPVYKFRSMYTHADEMLLFWKSHQPELWARYVRNNFKLADDPRVTPVGRWIRRSSIDELPQLFNVLKGEMSLVGPRPLLARELATYGGSIDIYANVRPGITGLWQISGRSQTTFDTRIYMDRWYVRNWSLWHDIVILLRTVRVVFGAEGAW